MEEARRQVLLEQNRTSEAYAMQDFLGVMNGIVDGFLKDQQHQSAVEKNSNSENDSSATPKDDSNQDDQVPKKDDSKENATDAECPKQKCSSHPGPLKDYFAAIDAIVNAMSKNQHQKTDEEENSNKSENGSDKNADRSKDNNDTADEHHPMKDFLTVMDTIVGTLMNPHHNENSNSEKKAADNKTEVDKLSGGNVDNNVVDQTIKTPAAVTENEVKEVLKNQVVTPRSSSSSHHREVSQLMTQVHVDEIWTEFKFKLNSRVMA